MPRFLNASLNKATFSSGIWSGLGIKLKIGKHKVIYTHLSEEPKDTNKAPSIAESMKSCKSLGSGPGFFRDNPPT